MYIYTQYQVQNTSLCNKKSSANHLKLKVHGYHLILFEFKQHCM